MQNFPCPLPCARSNVLCGVHRLLCPCHLALGSEQCGTGWISRAVPAVPLAQNLIGRTVWEPVKSPGMWLVAGLLGAQNAGGASCIASVSATSF